MNKDEYKLEIQELIEESKKKGLIKTYSEFLETEEAKIYALAEEEAEYYISKYNKDIKFKIGEVTEEELERFIRVYKKYLAEK